MYTNCILLDFKDWPSSHAEYGKVWETTALKVTM